MENNYLQPVKKSLIVGLTYDLASDYRLEAGDPEDMYGEFDSEETLQRNSIISSDNLFLKERVK